MLFDGIIDPDFKAGIAKDSARQKPQALGLWVCWTQRGVVPDNWAAMFVNGTDLDDIGLKATLVRQVKSPVPDPDWD